MVYLDEIKKLRVVGKHTGLDKLPLKKTRQTCSVKREGRHNVSRVFEKSEAGGGVSICIVIATAPWDIENFTRMKEFGGYIDLNRHWAHSLLKHMTQ